MPLTDEQAKSIKNQLLKQIEKLPEQQRVQIEKHISSMNNLQFEQFLIQNKLMAPPTPEAGKQSDAEKGGNKSQAIGSCVFCALANKAMDSFSIYEDRDYLSVLEIKPFSKGHAILIPKKHIQKTKSLPSQAYALANKIGKHIIKKLKAQTFQVTTAAEMNHAIINIIPVYKNQALAYERHEAKKQDLQELAVSIGKYEKIKQKPKSKSKKSSEPANAVINFQRRIP